MDEDKVDRRKNGNAEANGEAKAYDAFPTSHSLHILTHLSISEF